MTAGTATAGLRDIAGVRQRLADARDSQISQVVAMVDALPARGVADRLIAPLRPRLAQLRPHRPLMFDRLLFLPFDPVIVVPEDWSPTSPTVPRTLLAPVAEAMRQALGPLATEIEAIIRGCTTADLAVIEEAGRRLWPAAANAITAIDANPADWRKHALPRALTTVIPAVAGVLAQASTVQALIARAATGEPVTAPALMSILDCGARRDAGCYGMLLTLLLSQLPRPDEVLRMLAVNGTGSAVTRAAAERAVDTVLDAVDRDTGNAAALDAVNLGEAGAELARLVGLLDGLEAEGQRPQVPGGLLGGTDRAERQGRIAGMRRRLETACRSRFEAGLAGELLLPMLSLPADAGSAEIVRLEDTARELRRLEICGRRLGGQEGYGRMLNATAAEVRGMRGNAALTLADRVRIVEILAGPDDALALLLAGE